MSPRAKSGLPLVNTSCLWNKVKEIERRSLITLHLDHIDHFIVCDCLNCKMTIGLMNIGGHLLLDLPSHVAKMVISWFAWCTPRYTWKFWLGRAWRICCRPTSQHEKHVNGNWAYWNPDVGYKCYLKELSTNNPLLPIWLVLLYLPRRGGKEVRRGTFPVTYFCTTFLEGVTQGGGVIQTAVLSPYTPPSTSLLWRLHYCQCNLSWIFQTSYLLNFQVWLVCNDVWYSMPVT